MADNIQVTAGSGTTIATDQIGTVHYQKVKLVDGTADSEAGIPGDADNGLYVQVKTSLPAGTAAIGKLAANSGVDIGDVDVTSLPALPAGTNAIGKLAANSGVDIGDVDVTSLPALAAGTNIIGAVKRDVVNYTPIRKYYSNTGAVTDGIVWSPTAGKKWVVTDITLSTSAAATVTLEDDKTGGDAAVVAWDLAANGGVMGNLQTPWYSEEADADLIITTSAGNIKICVSGYEV